MDKEAERQKEGERQRPKCLAENKLAVSCGGTGGETEMDTHMPAKSRRWAAAYCLPRPFPLSSSAADHSLASL